MESIFLKLVNMSITASYLILAVIVFRLVLKKAPKYIRCILWGLVALRLICPFSFESVLSLIPNEEPLPQEFLYAATPQVNTGISAVNDVVNPVIAESLTPTELTSANLTQVWSFILSWVWAIGMAVTALYAVISYLRLRRRVRVSIPVGKNIRLCDSISSPFILGIIRPKIYLPSDINQETADHVLAHENAHLARKDHWWKPLGYLLLTVYWFNPLIWIAYVLLCRDIELACDERVVKTLDLEEKKAYSSALLQCSVSRKMIAACPLAFGEVGVKSRIKSVLNYKKPAFWIIVVAIIASIIVGVCFLTNPVKEVEEDFQATPHTFYEYGGSLSNVTAEDGYTILSQFTKDIAISIPKSVLPDSIYSEEGYTFSYAEATVYQTESTTIYLESVRFANEGDDRLYFRFDIAYTFGDSGTITVLPEAVDLLTGDTLSVIDKTITDDVTSYTDAVSLRGTDVGKSFTVYVDTDVCKAASGSLNFTVGNFVDLTYEKDTPLDENRLTEGYYIPVECLYMNPLSSYYAGDLPGDATFKVTENGYTFNQFTTIGNRTTTGLTWEWYSIKTAGDDLNFFINWLPSNTAGFSLNEDALYQRLDSNLHLLLQDGELLLIQGSDGIIDQDTVWAIYQLEKRPSNTSLSPKGSLSIQAAQILEDLDLTEVSRALGTETTEVFTAQTYNDLLVLGITYDGKLGIACYSETNDRYTLAQVVSQEQLQETEDTLVYCANVEAAGTELLVLICLNENIAAIQWTSCTELFTPVEQCPCLVIQDKVNCTDESFQIGYNFCYGGIPIFSFGNVAGFITYNQAVVYDGTQSPRSYILSSSENAKLTEILAQVPQSAITTKPEVQDYYITTNLIIHPETSEANHDDLIAELRYDRSGVDLIISSFTSSEDSEKLTYHIEDKTLNTYMESLADVPVSSKTVSAQHWSDTTEYSYQYVNFIQKHLVGWEYEVVEYTDDQTPFGIRCRPEWVDTDWIFISFWPDGFKPDNTRLRLREMTDAANSRITAYDQNVSENEQQNHPWKYIYYTHLAGDYVLINDGADEWLGDYDYLLLSEGLAVGILNRDNVCELASAVINDTAYQVSSTEFDFHTGIWTVHLSKKDSINMTTLKFDANGSLIQ